VVPPALENIKSLVADLKRVLEQEPAMRGEALLRVVEKKEGLIDSLERELRAAAAKPREMEGVLASLTELAWRNGTSLKFNRLRLQMSRLQKPKAKSGTARRLDILS
jgi:hypothetical protein